jgi:hypothetical protein
MRGVIKWFLILGLLLLLPFGYFFYRDIFSQGNISSLGGCTPYNIEWESGDTSVDLKWQTRDECVGYVRYGTDTKSLTGVAVDTEGSQRKKNHSVVLENLQKKTDYYVIFYSGDETYGQSGQPLLVKID